MCCAAYGGSRLSNAINITSSLTSFARRSLNSTYKKILMHMGGIELILDAIEAHPSNTEVVYRCLFALINIVIPPSTGDEVGDPASEIAVQQLLGVGQSSREAQWHCLKGVQDRVIICVVAAMSRHKQHRDIMGRGGEKSASRERQASRFLKRRLQSHCALTRRFACCSPRPAQHEPHPRLPPDLGDEQQH